MSLIFNLNNIALEEEKEDSDINEFHQNFLKKRVIQISCSLCALALLKFIFTAENSLKVFTVKMTKCLPQADEWWTWHTFSETYLSECLSKPVHFRKYSAQFTGLRIYDNF